MPDPATIIPDPATVIPDPATVIPDPAIVIPDLIRDPAPLGAWIADKVRNDADQQFHGIQLSENSTTRQYTRFL